MKKTWYNNKQVCPPNPPTGGEGGYFYYGHPKYSNHRSR